MKVYAKHNLIVESFNARNKKGNKLRKSRGIKEGEAFEVKREFTATGGATHGLKCLELFGPNGELYQVAAGDFNAEERKQEPEVKHEENELERLTRCIREIIKDPENEEFAFGFKKYERSKDEQDEGRIHLEKSVGDKKVFVQGWIDKRYISPIVLGSQIKTHTVVYFQNFNGDMHKKWVYPSKNKSDNSIKGKIRSIMREWVTELVKKEEEAQESDRRTDKERKQLMENLKEFNPGLPVDENNKSVLIPYGKSSGDRGNVSVRFDENGDYKIRFVLGEHPAFTKDGLGAFLEALTKAV